MPLLIADGEFIALGKTRGQQAKVFNHRLAIDANFQVADKLIELEIDLMVLLNADAKAELH